MAQPDKITEKSSAENSRLLQDVERLSNEVEQLKSQIEWFKRQLFGEKSEKQRDFDNPMQLTIADLLKDLPKPPKPDNEDKKKVSYTRGEAKKNNMPESPNDSGLRFDKSVPVKEINLPAPELEGEDADNYEVIGEKVTYRLAQLPGSHCVIKYTRPIIKKKSTQAITTTLAPYNVLDRSFADVSLLAGVLTDKFLYHMPLYRQHQKIKLNGIDIARSTLTNYTKRAIELLRPIYDIQLRSIMMSKILAMDETPIKAGRKKKGKMQRAYFWPIYGDMDEVCFTFSTSRGIQHVLDSIGDFDGTLLTDGYGAYKSFNKRNKAMTHAECWAHARRYFEKALKAEPDACAIALAYIARIYNVEGVIRQKQLSGQEKADYRSEYSKPVVDAFFNWCTEQCQRIELVNSNPLSKALKYAMNRHTELMVFLNDPDVPVDTNHLERTIRPIAMGRKNWLFCWTEIGAEHVGIIQSLLASCKLHDVNPYDYLVDVLQRVDSHPASKVHELTPRLWKENFGDNPMRSDLFDDYNYV